MEHYSHHSEIAILNGHIKEATNQYFEALTRKKDMTAARNIKLRLSSLYRNLESRIQLLGNSTSRIAK